MSTTTSSKATTRRGWRVAIAAGLASYIDAGSIVGTGSALVIMQGTIGLDPAQIGQLSALLTVAIAVGAIFGGRLGDKFGRRRVFLITLSAYAVAALLLAFVPNVGLLYIGLIVIGVAGGADLPVSLAMVAESAPEDKRGKMVAFSHLFWIFGILGVIIVSIFFGNSGALGVAVIFGHLAVVAIIGILLRISIPESKMWTESIRLPEQSGKPDPTRIRTLFRAPLIAPMVATGLFYALVNIAANTNGQFATFLYVNYAGVDVSTASLFGLVVLALGAVGVLIMMRVADRHSRNRTFVVAAIVGLVAIAVPLTFGISVWTLVTFGILGAISSAIAGEPIYKVWSQELFPTEHRSTAQGVTIAFARVVAAAVALVTPLVVAVGPALLFGFLLVTSAAAYAIGIFWVFKLRTFLASPAHPDDTESTEVGSRLL